MSSSTTKGSDESDCPFKDTLRSFYTQHSKCIGVHSKLGIDKFVYVFTDEKNTTLPRDALLTFLRDRFVGPSKGGTWKECSFNNHTKKNTSRTKYYDIETRKQIGH